MPKLDGSVGQGAENRRHDVAVVQAALGKARGRDRKPYWPGPIDGDYPRHRKALDQSIAVFQQAHRLRPSGRINRLGSLWTAWRTPCPRATGACPGCRARPWCGGGPARCRARRTCAGGPRVARIRAGPHRCPGD